MRQQYYDKLAAVLSIALLALLAGSTYYLAVVVERFPHGPSERKRTHEPDYFVENFSLTRLNERGEPTFRMSAQRLTHFPDDDSSEFTRPVLISLDSAKPRVTLTADRGTASSKGEQTHLHDNVVLTRAAQADNPALLISTDYLLLLPEQDIAKTDRPVRIAYGQSTLTGTGMLFDNGQRQLTVHSSVRGEWVTPPQNSGVTR